MREGGAKWETGKVTKVPRMGLVAPHVALFSTPRHAISAFLLLLALSSCEAAPAMAAEGIATYYTVESCQEEGNLGTLTASGEPYDESALTCALPHRDFGKKYRVTSLTTGRSVTVRHSDFGPGKKQIARGVVIDLSPAAYDRLGGKRGKNKKGVAWGELRVEVTPL